MAKLLSPWMVTGQNVLEAQLTPESDDHRLSGAGSFQVALEAVDAEAPDDDPPLEILKYQWSSEHAPLVGERPTTVLRHRFEAPRDFRGWKWQWARRYEPGDRAAVVGVVERLHEALVAGELPAVVELLRLRNSELAQAAAVDPNKLTVEQALCLEMISRGEGWTLEPLDVEAVVVEPHAGGRLVQVRRDDGRALITSESDAADYYLGTVLSHVDGTWTIVR